MRVLVALALLMLCSGAQAHPLAPALLELRQTGTDIYEVQWRTSTTRAGRTDVAPVMPMNCRVEGEPRAGLEEDAWVSHQRLRCDGSLIGQTIAVTGLERSRIAVILRLELRGQDTQQTVLDARTPNYVVPAPQEAPPVFPAYLSLGVEHLLFGFDHVLFVAGLVLLVRRLRLLVLTVTAFTLGHSLTLALATLGLVQVNQSLTEVGIAFSILLLAVEAARPKERRENSWFARWPWLMACAFGLLHGLGFAGALSEVGLPRAEIPLALFAFNLGIELGQLLVVGLLLGLATFWRKQDLHLRPALQTVPLHLMGSLAAYWCWERLAQAL